MSEGGCAGKLRESRFGSQALKSEEALLSCLACVGLAPVRPVIADNPGNSCFAGVKETLWLSSI